MSQSVRYKEIEESLDARVPIPCGYHMLLALPNVEETTEGGIYIPESRQTDERAAACVGKVLLMGPDCYKDDKRFPSGPYCEIGDWVMIRSYGGHRIMVGGQEFRLIADDGIMATVKDPSAVGRVMGA